MEETISAADANRHFSDLLRRVREGRSLLVTSHGKPVARIIPIARHAERTVLITRAALLSRLRVQAVDDIGHWTRDDLYED